MVEILYNKKRDTKAAEKADVLLERKPAWKDNGEKKLSVSIEDVSRLRKLKKTEAESTIQGAEYAERLKE